MEETQHIAALHSDAFSTIKVWNGKLSLNFAIIRHKVFWPWFFCDFFLADLFSAEFYSAYFSFSLHFFWQLFLGRLFRQLFGCFILPPFFCQFFSGRLFSANSFLGLTWKFQIINMFFSETMMKFVLIFCIICQAVSDCFLFQN